MRAKVVEARVAVADARARLESLPTDSVLSTGLRPSLPFVLLFGLLLFLRSWVKLLPRRGHGA